MIRMILVLLFSGIFVSSAAARNAEDPQIRALGPGVGGCCMALALHPENPDIMLTGVDMGAMFRTDDRGRTWTILGSNGVNPGYRGAFNAAFCPLQPNTAWAVSEHGAYKSLDAGKTWTRMTASISGAPLHWYGIAFDPADNEIVYLFQGRKSSRSIRPWSSGRIYRSSDGGKTWEKLTAPAGEKPGTGFCELLIDPASPRNARTLLIAGHSGLFRSVDGGKSWESIARTLPLPADAEPKFGTLDLSVRKGKASRIFVTVIPEITPSGKVFGGVYRSEDFGKTWKQSNRGLEKLIARQAEDNHRTGRVHSIVARSNASSGGMRCYAGSMYGVWRSDDGGKTWRQSTFPGSWRKVIRNSDGTEQALLLNNGKGNFRNSYCWQTDSFTDLAVSPVDPDLAVYNDNEGFTATFNGGKIWQDLAFDYTEAFSPGLFGKIFPVRYTHRIRSRGAHLLVCNAMRRDPFDSRTLYGAYMDLGIRVSRDGGLSWETPLQGLKTKFETGGWGWCRSVTVDPQVKGRVYASFGSDRMHISEDFGRTWREFGPPEAVRNNSDRSAHSGIVIDFDSPPHRRTLYACANNGVYKTTDGGRTWHRRISGMEGGEKITTLVKIGKTLWAASSPDDPALSRPGLFRSEDGAESWTRVSPELFRHVTDLDFCRSRPENLYVVAKKSPGYWGEGTIFRSSDGGKSWKKVHAGFEYRKLAVHPLDPERIYSAYTSLDLNRTTPAWVVSPDGGTSWKTLSGKEAITGWMMAILIDPKDPRKIYFHEPFTVYEFTDREAPVRNRPNSAASRERAVHAAAEP